MKSILTKKQLLILYQCLIESQISYGIIGWGGVLTSHMRALEVLQKWFLKIIFNREITYPSNELFTEAGVMDVRQLFCFAIATEYYKNKSEIKYRDHSYETRYKNIICEKPKISKAVGERSYAYLLLKLQDLLPQEVKDSPNVSVFKRRVKQWIHTTPREYINQFVTNRKTYTYLAPVSLLT